MAKQARTAWITGAGRGIGRACALALARDGHHVALTARSRPALDAVRAECERLGVKAVVAQADVTRLGEVQKAFETLGAAVGAPTILVNAAGLARSESFLKTSPAFMEELWDLNVMGTFHTMQSALPTMLEAGWGRIVNIASIASKHGAPYIAAYAASKHAVLGLTRSVAAEYAAKGVTVNAVCPGYVDTDMTTENVQRMVEKTGRPKESILEYLRKQSPQNRLVRPEEVAAMVRHLCLDESGGINGQSIVIDGGSVQA